MPLYIPIWFYSNAISQAMINKIETLYIPIWFYSNPSISYHLFIPLEKHFFVDR